jgi:hypothetical protein
MANTTKQSRNHTATSGKATPSKSKGSKGSGVQETPVTTQATARSARTPDTSTSPPAVATTAPLTAPAAASPDTNPERFADDSDSAANKPPQPEFCSIGRLLIWRKPKVAVLARAVQLHGVYGHDEFRIPHQYLPDSEQAQQALAVIKSYQAHLDDPQPPGDWDFEQDDQDWVGYRYGWYDNALPDFDSIEAALVPPLSPPSSSNAGQSAPAAANRFITLHDLLTINRVNVYDLELTIRKHGVWEVDWTEKYFEDPIHVGPEERHAFQTIVALGAFLIDRYKGRDAGRTLLGPDNPLYHFGWPQSELAKISFTDHHEEDRMGAVARLSGLRPLFDPKFITVGRLLITGQATVGQIALAAEQYGVQGRLEHNVARWYETNRVSLSGALGPISQLSELLKPFGEYEVHHLPVPEQLYHEPGLLKWGWEPEVLPPQFRDPACYGDATALPTVAPAYKPEKASVTVSQEAAQAPAQVTQAPQAAAETEESLHKKTEDGYLALIGILMAMIRRETTIYRKVRHKDELRELEPEENPRDMDVKRTIKKTFEEVKNVRLRKSTKMIKLGNQIMNNINTILREANRQVLIANAVPKDQHEAALDALEADPDETN